MRRLIGTVSALCAIAAAGLAFGQAYRPPAGVKMGINLYPITKFRGAPEVITKDTPRLSRPIDAESLIITHGIWELCSDIQYAGKCVRVDSSQEGIPVAITVRSARLVGDQGPGYVAPPLTANNTKPVGGAKGVERATAEPPRAPPAAVVAPQVAQGGAPGTNPSLRGVGAEFFAAPAKGGLRVLACSAGTLSGRCVQASADGFCAEQGYVQSSYSGSENVGGRAYLANVLCTSNGTAAPAAAPPPAKARKRGFLGL